VKYNTAVKTEKRGDISKSGQVNTPAKIFSSIKVVGKLVLKKQSESTYSEFWKLTNICSNLETLCARTMAEFWCVRELCGVLACPTPRPYSSLVVTLKSISPPQPAATGGTE
jgi:hypothetical protein